MDRAYKSKYYLLAFNEDVKYIYIFKKNRFPELLINKFVEVYSVRNSINLAVDSASPNVIYTFYFMLPYLNISYFAKLMVRAFVKGYCKNLRTKLVFSSFKIKHLIKVKDSVPRSLRSCVEYRYTCAECKSLHLLKQAENFLLECLMCLRPYLPIKAPIYLNT